jgi:hypothetical protein
MTDLERCCLSALEGILAGAGIRSAGQLISSRVSDEFIEASLLVGRDMHRRMKQLSVPVIGAETTWTVGDESVPIPPGLSVRNTGRIKKDDLVLFRHPLHWENTPAWAIGMDVGCFLCVAGKATDERP